MFILLFKKLFKVIHKKYLEKEISIVMMQKSKTKKTKFDVGIIAAGEGSRLKAEGIQLSKPMIPILGKPLIQWVIDAAINSGADNISCIVNEQSKDLESFLKAYYGSNKINLVVKTTESSFHSLKELSQYLTPPFLIAASDSVFIKEEFLSFIEYGINISDADVIVAATDFIDDEKPLYINLDEEGSVIDFVDNTQNYEFVTGGLYLFKKEIKKEIEGAMNANTNRLRNFLRFLIKREFNMQAFPFSRIIDVDHRSDIIKAEEILKQKKNKKR